MRAVCGVVAIDSAITTLVTDAPSTALTAIASTIEGNAISASITRIMRLVEARKVSGGGPMIVPQTPVTITVQAPMVSEMRAPNITRDRMSRPKWSVPNQLMRVRRMQARAEIVSQRIERREPVGDAATSDDGQHEGAADHERAVAKQAGERLARGASARPRCRDRPAMLTSASRADRRRRRGCRPSG